MVFRMLKPRRRRVLAHVFWITAIQQAGLKNYGFWSCAKQCCTNHNKKCPKVFIRVSIATGILHVGFTKIYLGFKFNDTFK